MYIKIWHPTRYSSFGIINFLPWCTWWCFSTIYITLGYCIHTWRCILNKQFDYFREKLIERIFTWLLLWLLLLNLINVCTNFCIRRITSFFFKHSWSNLIRNFCKTININTFSNRFDSFIRCWWWCLLSLKKLSNVNLFK